MSVEAESRPEEKYNEQPANTADIKQKDEGTLDAGLPQDVRECATCKIAGDHAVCGRLLPFDTNWIHLNCLLWSNDVLTDGHVIKQIQAVLNRAKNSTCRYCGKEGASITCVYKSCSASFHFNCAYVTECTLKVSKTGVKHKNFNQHYLTCHLHKDEHKTPNSLENFAITDRCYIIDTSEDAYRKKNAFPRFSLESSSSCRPYLLIGSLQITNIGELDTLSDHSDYLYPLNYACSRLYWSTTEIGKKVSYRCRIVTTNILKRESQLNAQTTSVNGNRLG